MEEQTPLRAYLATSLTELSEKQRREIHDLCRELKTICAENHVSLYLPFDFTDPVAHPHVTNPAVYVTDRKQVITSDLLFVLCTKGSYGVGQENEIAAAHGVPVVYLIQNDCTVSHMLLGSDARSREIKYADTADLFSQLTEFLSTTISALHQRRKALGEPVPLGIGASNDLVDFT